MYAKTDNGPQLPWWRIKMVWLVVAGPAVVVLAAVLTAVIAVRGADIVLDHDDRGDFSQKPALQGRNQAATAVAPK